MQAIVGRFEGLFGILGRVNYERLFVVSVVVATLTGSVYVYLVDFYFAGSADQAVEADPLVADRVAPIGRVILAEPVAAEPAVAESAVAEPVAEIAAAATDAPADESMPVESSAEGSVAEAAASDAGSPDVAAASDASPELAPELRTDQTEGPAAVSRDPIEALSASTEADEVIAAESEPSVPSEELQMTGPAATAEQPRPAPIYPPVPPGYMPMPAPGYAPAYPPYPAPPPAARQVPGAPFGYGPYRAYRAYPPSLYERSVGPPAGYPPPQGRMR